MRFIDEEGAVEWLTLGEGGGLTVFHDVIRPDRPVDYTLRFLPPTDAFYSFEGYLGELRLLPGRDGPPGAESDTLPPLKPLPRQLGAFAWQPGRAADLHRRLELARPSAGDDRFTELAYEFAATVTAVRNDRSSRRQTSGEDSR